MYEYNCTVERVVDGDTIDVVLDLGFSVLYKSRVRLYAIDTPESRTRDKDEKVRGKWLANFFQMLLAVVLLGTVVVDGVDINQAMCDKFLAVPYFGQNKAAVEAAHLSNRTKLIELGQFDPTTVSS